MNIRERIYQIIHASVDGAACAEKLIKLKLGAELDIRCCETILNICGNRRNYETFFGALARRLCYLKKQLIKCFEKLFCDEYQIVHRREIFQLRNIANFFGHLLVTDSISWKVLSCINLNEEQTTSSSRVYLKHFFLGLNERIGIYRLNERLNEKQLKKYLKGIFPHDDKNINFVIKFFTVIGLGGLKIEISDLLI